MSNRLTLIMRIFRIRVNDLATILSVDASIISKWRSGARTLSPTSHYLREIAEYIVSLDQKQNHHRIRDLLASDYEIPENCPKEQMVVYVINWICSNDSNSDFVLEDMLHSRHLMKAEQLYYWNGKEGRRNAVLYYMRYAISFSPGVELMSYSTESNEWFREDPEYLSKWFQLVKEFLSKNNSIRIIYPVNRNYHETAISIGLWLPIHLEYGVRGRYLRRYNENPSMLQTIMTNPGKMTLFGFSPDNADPSLCNTWTTNSSALCTAYDKILKRLGAQAVSIFSRYTLDGATHSRRPFAEEHLTIFEDNGICYFYNGFEHMMPFILEERPDFLDHCFNSPEEREFTLSYLQTMLDFEKKNECYFIIDQDVLLDYLKMPEIKSDLLSLLNGREIRVTNEDVREYVGYFLSVLKKYDNFYAAVTDSSSGHAFRGLSIWSGGERYINTFASLGITKSPIAVKIIEPTVSIALNQELSNIWLETPFSVKSKPYVIRTLTEALFSN